MAFVGPAEDEVAVTPFVGPDEEFKGPDEDAENAITALVDDPEFDEKVYLAQNPHDLDTAVEVAWRRYNKPATVKGAVEDVGGFLKGVKTGVVEGVPSMVRGFAKGAKNISTIVTSEADDPKLLLAKRENAAGVQLGVTGTVKLLDSAINKVTEVARGPLGPILTGPISAGLQTKELITGEKSTGRLTRKDIEDRLLTQSALISQMQEAEKGQLPGETAPPTFATEAEEKQFQRNVSDIAQGPGDPTNVPIIGAALAPGPIIRQVAGQGLKAAGKAGEAVHRVGDRIFTRRLARITTPAGIATAAINPEAAAKAAAAIGASWAANKLGAGAAKMFTEAGEEMLGAAAPRKQTWYRNATKKFIQGGAVGTTASIPFTAGAESPEEAGMMMGPGTFLGGTAGLLEGVREGRSVQRKAHYTAMVDDGKKAVFDTADEAAADSTILSKLDQDSQDLIHYLRGHFNGAQTPDGKPIKVRATDEDTFTSLTGSVSSGMYAPSLGTLFINVGKNAPDGSFVPRKSAAIRSALAHEGKHALDQAFEATQPELYEGLQKKLRARFVQEDGKPTPQFAEWIEGQKAALTENMKNAGQTPEQIEAMLKGKDTNYFMDEASADIGQAIMLGEGMGEFMLTQGLASKVWDGIKDWAAEHKVAVPSVADAKTGTLQAPSARGVAREVRRQLYAQGAEARKRLEEREKAQSTAPGAKKPATDPQTQASAPVAPPVTAPLAPAPKVPTQAQQDAAKALTIIGRKDAAALVNNIEGADADEIAAKAIDEANKAKQPTPATEPAEEILSNRQDEPPLPLSAGVAVAEAEAPSPNAAKPLSSPSTQATETASPLVSPLSETGAPAERRDASPVHTNEEVTRIVTEAQREAEASPQYQRARTDEGKRKAVANTILERLLAAAEQLEAGTLRRATDPQTGEVTIRGDIDPSNPLHEAILTAANLAPESVARLQTLTENKGRTVYLDYNSAAIEEGAERTETQRRKEYQAQSAEDRRLRGAKGTEQNKAFVPIYTQLNPGKSKGLPSVTVMGFSPDALTHNVGKLVEALTQAEEPTGYTGVNDPLLIEDINAMVENTRNGYRSDGTGPIKQFPDSGLPQPNLDYVAKEIPKERLDVLNAALNNRRATAEAKGEVAKTKQQEVLALAKLNQTLLEGSGETNPVRRRLIEKEAFPELRPAYEALNPDNIVRFRESREQAGAVRPTEFEGDRSKFTEKGLPLAKPVAGNFQPEGQSNLDADVEKNVRDARMMNAADPAAFLRKMADAARSKGNEAAATNFESAIKAIEEGKFQPEGPTINEDDPPHIQRFEQLSFKEDQGTLTPDEETELDNLHQQIDKETPGGFNEFSKRYQPGGKSDPFRGPFMPLANVDINYETPNRETKLLAAANQLGGKQGGQEPAKRTAAIPDQSRVQQSLRPETPREAGFRPITRWSRKEGLAEFDPAFHGKGAAGAEKNREQPQGIYFGYGDYVQEPELGNVRYEGDMDFKQLYDFEQDPLKLYELAKDTFKAKNDYRASQPQLLSEMEELIREHGYLGYFADSHQVGFVFHKFPTNAKVGFDEFSKSAPGHARRAPEMVNALFRLYPQAAKLPPSYFELAPEITKEQSTFQNEIANAYDALKTNNTADPTVQKAYASLNKKLLEQYEMLEDMDVVIEPWEQEGQPYANSRELQRDLRDNKHLYFFKTGPEMDAAHPLAEKSGINSDSGHELLMNDVLRAVHDAIAHGAFGVSFGPRGEEAAWKSHMATIDDPYARMALTTETRGQNSWVNFRGDLLGADGLPIKEGEPGYVPPQDRPFAEQKADLLDPKYSLTGDKAVDSVMDPILSNRQDAFQPKTDELGFYSKLQEVAEDKIKGAATSDQIRKTLKNSGVKDEEIEWVLGDLLKSKEKITPEELREEIQANGIQLKEVTKGSGSQLFPDWSPFQDSNRRWNIRTPEGNLWMGYETRQEAEDYIADKNQTPAKYATYQLPGGEHYRELVMTLPSRPSKPARLQIEKLTKEKEAAWEDYHSLRNDNEIPQPERGNRVKAAEERARVAQVEIQRLSNPEGFKTGHFDEPNIIFHARVNDRVTADGDSMLLAEEVQSDTHQQGRSEGYKKELDFPGFDDWLKTQDPVVQKMDKAIVLKSYEMDRNEAANAQEGMVPDLPFKGEGWKRLAIKHLIRKAIDEGKKRIGWTTGEQQVERYDLSKHISEVILEPAIGHSDQRYLAAYDLKGKRVVDKMVKSDKEIAEYVGKEAAEKLVNAPIQEVPAQVGEKGAKTKIQRISGLDLKVGGEGMTAFYDKILVNLANDIGKKYGAKVERVKIETGTGPTTNTLDDFLTWVESEKGIEVTPEVSVDLTKQWKEKGTGNALVKEYVDRKKVQEVWSLPITDEMKAAIGAGQPQFQPKAPDEGTGELSLGKRFTAEAMRQDAIKRKVVAKAEYYPEAIPPVYKKADGKFRLDDFGRPIADPIEYGLDETPLAKEAAKGIRGEDKRREALSKAYGDRLVEQFRKVEKNPDVMAGREWYQMARKKIKGHFGEDSLLFSQLLGATSARTPALDNYQQALDAYNQFKEGKYDDIVKRYLELDAQVENGELQFRKSFSGIEMGAPVTRKNFRVYLDSEGILPRKSNGKKFNANSMQVLNVLAGIWADRVGGPKTPNFSGNLAGSTFAATIDVWAARGLHRVGHEGLTDKRWRILPESETGVSNTDFAIGQRAYQHAADQLGMNPDDLQGVLWFAEKDVWDRNGWTRGAGAEFGDFGVLLDRTKTEGGKKRLEMEPSKQLELLTP